VAAAPPPTIQPGQPRAPGQTAPGLVPGQVTPGAVRGQPGPRVIPNLPRRPRLPIPSEQ
jgi:hypothetical protein